MAVHSSILAWRIPRIGAWWVTVHGDRQESNMTEQLNSLVVQVRDLTLRVRGRDGNLPRVPASTSPVSLFPFVPAHGAPHGGQQATASGDGLGPSHLVR